ncbi:MAG: cardiolipin synthase [Burkholderiales bacterium]|jgi:cardiolipin synthase|nr:cardiolipin synthase [Burkholderiales bacterium]
MMSVILGLWSAYIVLLILWIIWQKRPPAVAVGWILALAALPYLGFVIYHFFGPRRIERRRLQRSKTRDALSWHAHEHAANAPLSSVGNFSHLIRLGVATTGLPPATCNVNIITEGGAAFDAIFAAVGAAKRHVHLEYYIFEPDQTGTAFLDLLVAKAREGVEVRLLVDALGSNRLRQGFLQPLINAGGKVAFFHPFLLASLGFRPVVNLRTHRKIVVCDDWTGFVGGVNITDNENERIHANAYKDIHLSMNGDAVFNLQHIFWEDWHYTTGEEPPHTSVPTKPIVGNNIVHILGSGPDTPWEPIRRVYLSAIATAQHRVWLTTPYFVPDEVAVAELTSAALRGVDVRIVLPKKTGHFAVTLAARSYFDELTAAGVVIHEYTEKMLHSKTMLIDDRLSFIGSVNFDNRSFKLNFEVCALVFGQEVAQSLATQFEQDMKGSITVLPNRRIFPWVHLAEATARLLGPLL